MTHVYIDKDLESLIPKFLINREYEIKELKNSLEKKDFQRIKELGHMIKGVAGGYGFDYIGEVGFEIEKKAIEKNKNELEKII